MRDVRESYSDSVLQAARALRAAQTATERRLWSLLRNRQLRNAKFRRQQPMGPYILDFYCHAAGLVIEVDGAHHSDSAQKAYDEDRTAWLQAHGLRVIRFTNYEILLGAEGVLERICLELQRSPSPQPSPTGRGGEKE